MITIRYFVALVNFESAGILNTLFIFYYTTMGFLINVIITAIAVGIGAYVLPGVTVDGPVAAIIVALLLGLANASIGRLLRVITAPINRITLGLMSLVI